MTLPRGREPEPELTTTRVGGGKSARLIALGATVVLGLTVYIGVSGQGNSTNTSPAPPAVADASPTQTPRPSPRSLPPDPPHIEQISDGPTKPRPYQFLGTVLEVANQEFEAVLEPVAETGPSQAAYSYAASYRVPFPLLSDHAELHLASITSTVSHDVFETYGIYGVSLASLVPGEIGDQTVLDVTSAADSSLIAQPDADPLKRNGFELSVTAENRQDQGILAIKLQVAGDPTLPSESYSLTAPLGRRTVASTLNGGAGHYQGVLDLGDIAHPGSLRVTLRAIPTSDPLLGRVKVGSWLLSLPPLNSGLPDAQRRIVVASRPIGPGEADIIRNGYTLDFDVERIGKFVDVSIALVITPLYPNTAQPE
jgi:hypothetical protein